MLRSTALTLFLAASAVSGPMLLEAQAQTYSFSNVTLQGNDRVDAATILSYAGIKQGEAVTAGGLNDAYQRILNSGLFETVELSPRGGTLVITVKEYPTINVINFEGNAKLKDDALAEIITSQSRRVFSPALAEADAAAIVEAYRQSGRIAATVDPRIIRRSDNRVDLVFEIAEGKVAEIERLGFVGNRAYSDRRLRQVLETKQAGLLRQFIQADTLFAERLELDKQLLRDFYLSRGYVDFQVMDASAEVTRERDASFVTFTVREGQQFKFGRISAVSEIEGVDIAEFRELLRVRPGVVYSPAVVENNVARMEALALRKGLNFVRIDPRVTRNDKTQSLDIEFALTRGQKVFVERIDIEGNTTTLDQVVRRQFRTVEGDPFNPREVRQAAERIRALGFFADASVESEQGSAGDQVVVKVGLEEKPTGSLTFGVSYGVSSGVGFNVGLTETNFLGRGQTVGVNLSLGKDNKNSSFNFIEPAFLGRDLKFRIGAGYFESDNENARYDTRRISFNTGIEFPVSENGRLELRYTLTEKSLLNVEDDASDILEAEETRGALLTSALGYTYSYDTRLTGLNPNGGFLLRFSQDYGGVGGDVQSITSTALALAETKVLNEEVTVRAVVEGGMINTLNGDSSVTDRFFGNGKIRGFEPNGLGPRDIFPTGDDALGGNYFAAARLEADFPLGLPEEYGITGGVFFDIGSVWGLDNTAGSGVVDDEMYLRSSVGFSVYWTTGLGPLKFNFAKPILKEDYDEEQLFDLTISTQF
ncbi:outer membrane protein assembly factor BamA [Paracoccaceae bacterium Fryx2]|nr:outer membrane protein assembly factor BamA [Paracoccaceae bacterium Fryx2]